MGTGVFMFTLDASIVNVALPTLVAAFGTTFSTVQWIVLGYLLIATALVMAAARLGDIHGKKRAYLAGLAIFTLGISAVRFCADGGLADCVSRAARIGGGCS